ncbi:ATPdependent RNA helicase [Physocladia obscura]|uniref:ATPdependent RNA helicase n=1 Tax=Physocladia obscura TaxID=109957 RepID=A0AAD5ST48_9FUNG|nr:ATPdependent RNA helicase [Physocladia obscura]
MEYDGRSWSDGVAQAIMEVKRKDDHELVKAVLVAALFPNVIKIEDTGKKGGFKCIASGDEAVRIHPSSVNAKTKKFPSRFLVFHEKVKTTQVFIRDCSSVSPFALAFFGGKLTWDRRQRILNLADGWIQFAVNNNAAVTIEAARTAFDELLQMKIENPELDVSNADLVKQIVSLVVRP